MLKRSFLYFLVTWIAILVNSISFLALAEEDDKEDVVRAAFILNFIKFIELSDGKSLASLPKIDVCVLGDSGFVKTLQIFEQNSSSKQKITLVKENNLNNITAHCQILFVSKSELYRLKEILRILQRQPVLTVSNLPDFIGHGGMIEFIMDEGKVKLVVNKGAIESARMHMDSQLLEIAFKVVDR